MPNNTDDILASAKKTLAHADNLTKSVAAQQPPAATQQEYANAPYSLVKKWGEAAKKAVTKLPGDVSESQKEAGETGRSIKEKLENVRKATQ